MLRLAVTAIAAVLLHASPSFAEGLGADLAKVVPCADEARPAAGRSATEARPSLSASQITAIQYHEPADPLPAARDEQPSIASKSIRTGAPGFMMP